MIYLLCSWLFAATIENQTQVSVLNNGGNAEQETYHGATKHSFEFQRFQAQTKASLTRAFAQTQESTREETIRQWNITQNLDRKLKHNSSVGISANLESDVFAGITQRDNFDLNLQKAFDKEKEKLSLKLGFRYTKENQTTSNTNPLYFNKGLVDLSYSFQSTTGWTYELNSEYIPNFSQGEDYNVNIDNSLTSSLSDLLSLKTSHTWRYDNLPTQGKKMHDYSFKTSLIARY